MATKIKKSLGAAASIAQMCFSRLFQLLVVFYRLQQSRQIVPDLWARD